MSSPRGEGRVPRCRLLVESTEESPAHPQERPSPSLLEEELPHALNVLGLKAGDALEGLDGQGRIWPLVVVATSPNSVELMCEDDPIWVPRPGDPESDLPAIEIAVAFPAPTLAEEMVARLTQLGVARIRPLITEHSLPGGSDSELTKLGRVAREACKQIARAWFPEILPPQTLDAWLFELDVAATHLDVTGPTTLLEWADGRESSAALAIAVGPTNGWSDDERDALYRAGVGATNLAPHVLPTETAAETSAAILVRRLLRKG